MFGVGIGIGGRTRSRDRTCSNTKIRKSDSDCNPATDSDVEDFHEL